MNNSAQRVSAVVNALGYQAVWFACVIGAASGRVWIGLTASALFALATLGLGGCWRADLRTLAIAVPLGFGMDSLFAAAGWLVYSPAWPSPAAPAWIAAIWVGFAMTMNHSLVFLRGRFAIAAVLGLAGAPLAYLGAARGFGVLHVAEPAPVVLLALGLAWAALLPAILVLDARLPRRAAYP